MWLLELNACTSVGDAAEVQLPLESMLQVVPEVPLPYSTFCADCAGTLYKDRQAIANISGDVFSGFCVFGTYFISNSSELC